MKHLVISILLVVSQVSFAGGCSDDVRALLKRWEDKLISDQQFREQQDRARSLYNKSAAEAQNAFLGSQSTYAQNYYSNKSERAGQGAEVASDLMAKYNEKIRLEEEFIKDLRAVEGLPPLPPSRTAPGYIHHMNPIQPGAVPQYHNGASPIPPGFGPGINPALQPRG